MRIRAHLLLALWSPAMTACLSTPLGSPGAVKPEVRLLGKWLCSGERDGTKKEARLDVMRFDDWQYYAEWAENEEKDRFRAYPSRVGGTIVVNVTDLSDRFTPWPWTVVRVVNLTDNSFALDMLDTDRLRSADEKAARREIADRVLDPSLYKRLATCGRREK
jgi:hypothetical protein